MSDPFKQAAALAESFEGFSSKPYLCPAKVWTIGNGSTRDANGNPVTATTPDVTPAQADALMQRDLKAAYVELARDVKVPLTDEQGAALLDFIYNLGGGNFRSSTLLRKLNARDYAGVSDEFLRWDHAGATVMAGLTRRREAERKLFNS